MSGLNDLHEMFFGTLSKEYCSLFYVLMIVSFVLMCSVVLVTIGFALNTKKSSFKIIAFGVFELLVLFVGYLQQRLLYSMCKNQV